MLKKVFAIAVSFALCIQMCPLAYAVEAGDGLVDGTAENAEEPLADGGDDSAVVDESTAEEEDVLDSDSSAGEDTSSSGNESPEASTDGISQSSGDGITEDVEAENGEYDAASGAYAESWRYSNGELITVSPLARASKVTWSERDGVYYGSNGMVVEGAQSFGIDVSAHQGKIDWAKVKAAGVDFAIIRCGYGSDYSSQDDAQFLANVKGAMGNGIAIGVYLYSYAYTTSMAQSEANHVLRLLDKAGLDPSDLALPVYYDLENEVDGKPGVKAEDDKVHYVSNSMLASIAETFADAVSAKGFVPGVYANLNWWNNFLTSSKFEQWDRWVAQYNTECDYEGNYSIWQCMSNGSVDGISGNCDIDFCYSSAGSSLDDLALSSKDVIADGVYTVHSAADGSKVLDVKSGSVSNSSNVQLYAGNGTNAQQWSVSHDEQGYVTFTNINSGKVLDVKSGKSDNGTNVQQYAGNSSRAQKWIVVDNGDGTYGILSALKSGVSLDVKSGSTANGANVQIYASNGTDAQAWVFSKVPDQENELDLLAERNKDVLPNGTYYIVSSLGSGVMTKGTAVLDVKSASKSNKGNVQIYAANGTGAQQWKVTHDRQGYVTFTSVNSGKVLDVASGKYASGTNVQQYASNSSRAQKWIVTKEGSSYAIRSALWGNVVLDISTDSTSNGSNVQIKGAGTSLTADQKWNFINIESMRDSLDKLAASNKNVLNDGVYVIKSALANTKVLDVASGSTANSANVQIYASNMTNAQKWRVSHDAQGYVVLTNIGSGKVLDVKSANIKQSTNVQQYAGNDSYAQKWIVTRNSDGSFTICSALWDGLVLDVKSGATSNKTNVQVYTSNGTKAQSWQFLSTDPSVELCADLKLSGTYVIASGINAGYCLDVKSASTSNGANVQLYKKNGTSAQKFKFVYVDGYYQIVNVKSGKALDVDDGNLVPSTNVQQWTRSSTNDNQLFSIKKNADGSYSFTSKSTGLALDVSGGKAKNSANVQVYTPNGTKAQSFVLTRA